MPNLLDVEEFCKDLKEVRSPKIFARKKFHPEGLFSEQIFGPIKNFTCQCGVYHGPASTTSTCKLCGVDVVSSKERRKRFAKIILPIPLVNPIFLHLLIQAGGNEIKRHIEKLMNDENSLLYVNMSDKSFYVSERNDEKFPVSKFNTYDKIDAIIKLVEGICNTDDLKNIAEWKFIKKHINKLIVKNIVVLPPEFRPITKMSSRDDKMRTDEINKLYAHILTNVSTMNATIVDLFSNKNLYYTYWKYLQEDLNTLYDHIINKLSKKEGLIRENVLGKRMDFSGRGVIVVDPQLRLNDCVLPYSMILELFKLPIAKKLIEIGSFKFINSAIEFVNRCIEFSDDTLFDIANDIIKDEVCILNRQPSLHRLGLLGFNIKMGMGSVIRLHPLMCAGYNADFDGDQMAVYLPISKSSRAEVTAKLLPKENLTSPTNSSLTTTPSQDIILGIYILTSGMLDDEENNRKVIYKGKTITESLKKFNDCLPEDYPLVETSIGKKELISLLNDINENYPSDVVCNVLDNIKEAGFRHSTSYGVTLSLAGMVSDDMKKLQKSIYDLENPNEQIRKISSKETEDILRKKFKYAYFIESGSRGSWDQARQIVMTRGYVSNFKGDIMSTPIKANLLDGLTPEEFFLSTYGCRKGLLDTALNTSNSGFLSRKLIFSCSNLQKHTTLEDCGTKDYLDVFVEDAKKAKSLEFRFYLNDKTGEDELITRDIMKDIIGKIIKLRSPIYCKNESICHKCYGNLYKVLHSRFIGIIAAQALGEVGTQLVLRTFHLSGVAKVKKGDVDVLEEGGIKQDDIIGDLSTVSKLLHVSDKENITPESLAADLYKVYSPLRDIHHVHYESVISQLMWVGSVKWRLHPKREEVSPKFFSIQTVPEKESWILGLGFSNAKKNILRGITNPGRYKGILDSILLGKRFKEGPYDKNNQS